MTKEVAKEVSANIASGLAGSGVGYGKLNGFPLYEAERIAVEPGMPEDSVEGLAQERRIRQFFYRVERHPSFNDVGDRGVVIAAYDADNKCTVLALGKVLYPLEEPAEGAELLEI